MIVFPFSTPVAVPVIRYSPSLTLLHEMIATEAVSKKNIFLDESFLIKSLGDNQLRNLTFQWLGLEQLQTNQ